MFTEYWFNEAMYALDVGPEAIACMVQEEYTNGDNIK